MAEDSSSRSMTRLLRAGLPDHDAWLDADCPAVLSALLSGAATDLIDPEGAGPHQDLCELFTGTPVDADRLRALKTFAKRQLSCASPVVPGPVARVLYYASVARATRTGLTNVSSLDAAGLAKGLAWCDAQAWLTPALRRQLGLDAPEGR